MADLCGSCIFLDLEDVQWGDRYYCPNARKYLKASERGCSDFRKANNGNSSRGFKLSGWYITTMVCNILGYADDCEVLVLTQKLKEYLATTEEGVAFLEEYNQIGPRIATLLSAQENRERKAMEILQSFLIPCALAVKENDFNKATTIYINMTNELKAQYGFLTTSNELTIDASITPSSTRIRTNPYTQQNEC